MNIRPGAIGWGLILPRKVLQPLETSGTFARSPFAEVQSRPLEHRTRAQAPPAARVAQTLGRFQQRVGAFQVHSMRGDPRHYETSTQDALQHGAGVYERY